MQSGTRGEPATTQVPLIALLIEANKRVEGALHSARAVSGKLFGASPEETVGSMPEISVSGLAHRLVTTIIALDDELARQHNALGTLDAAPQQAGQQGRAVSY